LYDQLPHLSPNDRFNVERAWNDYDRLRKLPEDFIRRKAEMIATCSGLWNQALGQGRRFSELAEPFACMVAIWREEADLVGFEAHPYDVHLELFHPGLTTAKTKQFLETLVSNISVKNPSSPSSGQKLKIEGGEQEKIIRDLLQRCGLLSEWGRVDSGFPCTVVGGPQDIRISVRFDEEDFVTVLSDAMHEFGHALYNRHLPASYFGSPLGLAPSTSMQEALARFWEIHISKEQGFREFVAQGIENLTGRRLLHPADFSRRQRALRLRPDRIEADEATYHLHIYIRFIIEERLLSGTVNISEIPELWNALYEEYLGLRPNSDQEGVLQEASWFYGTPGYFPCYSYGSYYAFVLHQLINDSLPDLSDQIHNGNFSQITAWLIDNVLSKGAAFEIDLLSGYKGESEHLRAYGEYLCNFCAGVTQQIP
jgi:carboxypeptidase Taq